MFQSTPSCGGRPQGRLQHEHGGHVSIHALLRRATADEPEIRTVYVLFQSTPSCGGRLRLHRVERLDVPFQSTPSCGGRLQERAVRGFSGWFQSTPSCGGRLRLSIATLQKLFQSDLRESPSGSCNFTTVKKPFEKYDINPPYYIYRGTHRENTRA